NTIPISKGERRAMRQSLIAARWCFKAEGKFACRHWASAASQRFYRSESAVEDAVFTSPAPSTHHHHMKPSSTESSESPKPRRNYVPEPCIIKHTPEPWTDAAELDRKRGLQQELMLERMESLQKAHQKIVEILVERHELTVQDNIRNTLHEIKVIVEMEKKQEEGVHKICKVAGKLEDLHKKAKEVVGNMDVNHVAVVEKMDELARKLEGLQAEAKEQHQEVFNKLDERKCVESVKNMGDQPYEKVVVEMAKQHEEVTRKIDEFVGKTDDLHEERVDELRNLHEEFLEEAKEQNQMRVNKLEEQHREMVKNMEYQLYDKVVVEMWKQHMKVTQKMDEVVGQTKDLHKEAKEQHEELVHKLGGLHEEIIQLHNDMKLRCNDRTTSDFAWWMVIIGLSGCSIGITLLGFMF
ncbi:hypothetical protein GOP47_0030398, partial [Adiantum capillus-veneris]